MSIKELIDNGYDVVIDTNVLLNVYRYSPEFSEFALNCLKAVGEHIILPATVRMEFAKHYRREFAEMERRFEKAIKETANQIERSKTKILSSCNTLEHLQFQDVDELRLELDKKLDDVKKELDKYYENHAAVNLIQHSWAGTDHLLGFVGTIDQDDSVMPAPTQEDIYRWCDEGEMRYKSEIPPGFKDAKNKDGVRKYSDLILWEETLRYAKNNLTNIIFVTDDVKADWWEYVGGTNQFHTKLMTEFSKTTGQTIFPLTSHDFYMDISDDYGIEKTDAVEIALRMTDEDYCLNISDNVFGEVEIELMYNAGNYINMESAHIGSEGIDEFDISNYAFVRAERISRDTSHVIYEFTFDVTVEGTSYDYLGRDDDTKEVIRSEGKSHVFEGQITIQVEREAEVFYDFEDDNSYENVSIVGGELEEISFHDYSTDPGEFGYCPRCGRPLNFDNSAGNGFCRECTREYDLD